MGVLLAGVDVVDWAIAPSLDGVDVLLLGNGDVCCWGDRDDDDEGCAGVVLLPPTLPVAKLFGFNVDARIIKEFLQQGQLWNFNRHLIWK